MSSNIRILWARTIGYHVAQHETVKSACSLHCLHYLRQDEGAWWTLLKVQSLLHCFQLTHKTNVVFSTSWTQFLIQGEPLPLPYRVQQVEPTGLQNWLNAEYSACWFDCLPAAMIITTFIITILMTTGGDCGCNLHQRNGKFIVYLILTFINWDTRIIILL